jgi:hypothetical protein
MPVEFTLPLTKLEQAVADARENEKVMLAKVEDAKAILKSAKAAWEEAVGEVFRALDEMIADKRQPSLFDDRTAGEHKPGDEATTTTAAEPVTGQPLEEVVTVEILTPPPTTHSDLADPSLAPNTLASGPSWRALMVADHLDGPGSLFDTLSTFGVVTLGELADALRDGKTFNFSTQQVHDLYEAIENVSQEDAEPVRFDRERGIATTVKEKDAGEEWEEILDKRQQQASDEERESEAAKHEKPPILPSTPFSEAFVKIANGEDIAPEPEKPAKKKRGRKPKGEAVAAVEPAAVEPTAAAVVEPAEPGESEPATSFDEL